MTSPHEIALSCFERIQGEFPKLAMERVHDPEHVELEMSIPQQPGLMFDVHLNLQNVDELYLNIACVFCVSWFPCTDGDVSERFVEAVCGVLSGAFRVLAVYSGPRHLKSYLQRPQGAQWETIASHHNSFALPFSRRRKAVIQNVTA